MQDVTLTRNEILEKLKGVLRDVLDLESTEAIRPETRLREELHIDSLGMVDLVIGVEETFGVKMRSDLNIFGRVTTVQDAVDLVIELSKSRK